MHHDLLCKAQECDNDLSFATDAWSSPNHCAFIVVTMHLEKDGVPLCLLLDIVEVTEVHIHAPQPVILIYIGTVA